MKLKIKRRLSTVYSLKTDSSIEHMNQKVKNYLGKYVSFVQDDGLDWLDVATSTINARDSFLMKMSPFFIEYNWHLDIMDMKLGPNDTRRSSIADADRTLYKLQDIHEWTQSAMALAQQRQEETANQKRDDAISFKVDDKVGLDLTNINTNGTCKKLDAKYAKFTILEAVDTHTYCLDTPSEIHNVFHMKHLRLVALDPLSGQIVSDPQSVGIAGDTETVEYEVEKILKERKGQDGKMEYLMKWNGYVRPTWKPRDVLEETSALDVWKRQLEREKEDNMTD